MKKETLRVKRIRKVLVCMLAVFLGVVTCVTPSISAEEIKEEVTDYSNDEEENTVAEEPSEPAIDTYTDESSTNDTSASITARATMGTLLTPVVAWKSNADEPSMMASMLYEQSYLEVTDEGFYVTFYFVPTTIMNIPISPEKVGGITYVDESGEYVDAIYEVYDELTKVRAIKIKVTSFDIPVPIHIAQSDYGQDIRLKFDLEASSATTTPPVFEQVVVNADPYDKQWVTSIGSSKLDYVFDTTELNDGTLVSVGYVSSTAVDGNFEGLNKGGSDAYVAMHASDGTLKKLQSLGSTGSDNAYSVIPNADGGFLVAGSFGAATADFEEIGEGHHGSSDIYIAKYNADGEKQWVKNYGGSGSESVTTIRELSDGSYAIVGDTNSTDGDFENAGYHGSYYDIYVMHLNADFEVQWTTCMGGTVLETPTKALVELEDGTIMIGGHTSSKNGSYEGVEHIGSYNMFLAKFNRTNGNINSIKKYPVAASRSTYMTDMKMLSDGNILISCSTTSATGIYEGLEMLEGTEAAVLMKVDPNGNVIWLDGLQGGLDPDTGNYEKKTTYFVDAYEAANGDIVAVGASQATRGSFLGMNRGGYDMFVSTFKVSGEGYELESLANVGGTDVDYFRDCLLTADGSLVLTSQSKSADIDFEGITNQGSYDVVLLRTQILLSEDEEIIEPNNPDETTDPSDPEDPSEPTNPTYPTTDPEPTDPVTDADEVSLRTLTCEDEKVSVVGNFPADVELVVKKITDLDTLIEKMRNSSFISKNDLLTVYELTLYRNGEVYEFEGEVSVTFAISDELAERLLNIAYISPEYEIEYFESTLNEKNLTFKTTHFSTYAIYASKVTSNPSTASGGAGANTGDQTNTTTLWMLVLISAGYLTIRKLKTR